MTTCYFQLDWLEVKVADYMGIFEQIRIEFKKVQEADLIY